MIPSEQVFSISYQELALAIGKGPDAVIPILDQAHFPNHPEDVQPGHIELARMILNLTATTDNSFRPLGETIIGRLAPLVDLRQFCRSLITTRANICLNDEHAYDEDWHDQIPTIRSLRPEYQRQLLADSDMQRDDGNGKIQAHPSETWSKTLTDEALIALYDFDWQDLIGCVREFSYPSLLSLTEYIAHGTDKFPAPTAFYAFFFRAWHKFSPNSANILLLMSSCLITPEPYTIRLSLIGNLR